MIRLLEAGFFVCIAAVVHAGLLSYAPGPVGAAANGDGGHDVATLVSARASDAAMVKAWKTAPTVQDAAIAMQSDVVPETSSELPRADMPAPALGAAPALPEMTLASLPKIDPVPAALPPAPKPPKVTPVARPKVPKVAPPKAAPTPAKKAQPAAKASGQGQRKITGSKGAAQTHSQTKATENALQAKWGRQIHRKLTRAFVYPSGVTGKGTAKLELLLSPNGKLRGVRLVRGTGIAALDKAALRAAKRAGRFPKAPKGLTQPSYKFTMPLEFRG